MICGLDLQSGAGTDLAGVLNKNPDVVSWWVGEGMRRRLGDGDFANDIDRLEEKLAAALAQELATNGKENGRETDFPAS